MDWTWRSGGVVSGMEFNGMNKSFDQKRFAFFQFFLFFFLSFGLRFEIEDCCGRTVCPFSIFERISQSNRAVYISTNKASEPNKSRNNKLFLLSRFLIILNFEWRSHKIILHQKSVVEASVPPLSIHRRHPPQALCSHQEHWDNFMKR